MSEKSISIVASYTGTVPGKLIKLRAAMKFWNRYDGDGYSHISLSRDDKLNNMMSFARKKINNPFCSGLVKEDIRKGMFVLKPEISCIAVMKVKVTEEQFDKLSHIMDCYWENRDNYSFNFAGLTTMLIFSLGVAPKNKFFCSQWVATVLEESGISIFENRNPKNIKPFDFYCKLKDHIVYEGLTVNYPNNRLENVESQVQELQYVKKIDFGGRKNARSQNT